MNMLNKVTFTGVDRKTDIRELQRIKKEYPFVEFGVLVSRNNTGTSEINRYPDPWIIEILKLSKIPCSVHVCGSLARNAMASGNFQEITAFLRNIRHDEFQRMQLNIGSFDGYQLFRYQGSRPIIIQVSNEQSAAYYGKMQAQSEKVQALFDISGGRGISGLDGGFALGFPAKGYVGFAGGLGPDNVKEAVEYLTANVKNRYFWIDMETGVRTDDWFDTDKVWGVCETVAPFII